MSASPAAPSSTDAITAALSQNWNEAIRLNLLILEENPEDIDAYNRLGFAYLQQGDNEKARKAYHAVLKRDPYNQIAQKNLLKLQNKNEKGFVTTLVSPLMFLEEPGKTKIVSCVHPAPDSVMARLSCGQEVRLKVKKHCIEIRNDENTYLAALPDDISYKLGKYIQGGNEYKVVIRSIAKNTLTVFIREISRGEKYRHQPSFTPTSMYVSSGKSDVATQRPETNPTGEEDEE